MQEYYKTKTELAIYLGVAESTVRNWIARAVSGKLNLQLKEINGKHYIIKNTHNHNTVLKLIQDGRKHRSMDHKANVYAGSELYSTLDSKQILSLINSLEINKEIPFKYVYLGRGADHWDNLYYKMLDQGVNKSYSNDLESLEILFNFIIKHFADYPKINLVDLGPGNSNPVLKFIDRLQKLNKLNSYITVDISKTMLKVSEKKLKGYGLKIKSQQFIHDFEINSLQDILFGSKQSIDGYKIPNLILLLGQTLSNGNSQSKILQNIKEGMYPNDYLLISGTLDDPKTRINFSTFETEEGNNLVLHIPQLLGLTQDLYKRELIYNQITHTREYNLVLKKDVLINFSEYNTEVILYKNERINLWKCKDDTIESISQKSELAGLNISLICKYPDEPEVIYMLGL
jgi:uncharacterized SAM-dependent methyltransferase